MSVEAIRAGEAFVNLNVHMSDYQKNLQVASAKLDAFGKNVGDVTSKMSGAFQSLGGSLSPLAPMISMAGISLSGLSASIGTLENLNAQFWAWRANCARTAAALQEVKKAVDMNTIAENYLLLTRQKQGTATEIWCAKIKLQTLSEIQAGIQTKLHAAWMSLFGHATKNATATVGAYTSAVGSEIIVDMGATKVKAGLVAVQNLVASSLYIGAEATGAYVSATQLLLAQNRELIVSSGSMTASQNLLTSSTTALVTIESTRVPIQRANCHALALTTQAQMTSNVATKMSTISLLGARAATFGLTVVSYVAAIGLKIAAGAIWLFNAALSIMQTLFPIALIFALCAALYQLGKFFFFSGSATEKQSKAMENLRKKHDEYRESAKQSCTVLEELNEKETLSAQQVQTAQNAWEGLQAASAGLGLNLQEMGITFDETTGKINGSAEAMAKLKEAMRTQEFNDLQNEIQAQSAYLDELKAKLKPNGKTGFWRTVGTYITFGGMDNADEIQQKITDTQKKIQENVQKQKIVADFSVEFRENEKKLQEFYDKDMEVAKNAVQKKIEGIQTEFAERRTLLEQLIAEAEAREGLTSKEMDQLAERKKALEGLNAEQARRIELLKEEERAKVQKIKDDFNQKRAENAENKQWKQDLESDPTAAAAQAAAKSAEADAAFDAATKKREEAVGSDMTAEQMAALDAEVTATQKEADKWYTRKEESARKVAEAAQKEQELSQSRAEEIQNLKDEKEQSRADDKEKTEWETLAEKTPEEARTKAQNEQKSLQDSIGGEYEKLENLAQSGASEQDYKAQLAKVQQMEEDIDQWSQRLEDLDVSAAEKAKNDNQKTEAPASLMEGTVEARKQFNANRNAAKNPLEEKADESNRLLAKLVDGQETMNNEIILV